MAIAMLRVEIVPAQPPLPTASNFPFHTSANGNHTSISICESEDGVSTAAMRQWAGSRMGGGVDAPGSPGGGPAGMDSAAVIVVFGSGYDLSFSQGTCANAIDAPPRQTTTSRIIGV